MASPVEPAGLSGLAVGRTTTVAAPATSANVGPGFDSFGLALEWRDRVSLEVVEQGYEVDVTGEGATRMPRDDSHLILATAVAGLRDLGLAAPGLRLRAHNTVPHGRGLGSSSAAIVAGLLAARGLAGLDADPHWLIRHAVAIEGHPDNVAAAIRGGFVLAYGAAEATHVVSLPVHPDVSAWVFVAGAELATSHARRLLPTTVPHGDAVANSGRAALLVHALGADPGLLLEATRDWLHQDYRRVAMPDSYALLTGLRTDGYAAVVSGAGPSVLVLGRNAELAGLADRETPGFSGRRLGIGSGGVIETGASM